MIFALRRVSLFACFVLNLTKSGRNVFLKTDADWNFLSAHSKAVLSMVSASCQIVQSKLKLRNLGFDP